MGHTIWIADAIAEPGPLGPRWLPWREYNTVRKLWPLDPPARAEAHRQAVELRQLLSRPHGGGALVAVRPAAAGEPLWPEEMADCYDLPPCAEEAVSYTGGEAEDHA